MLEKNRLNEDEIDKLIQIRDKLEEQSKTQKEFAERISESENMKDELVEELRKENEKITKEIVGQRKKNEDLLVSLKESENRAIKAETNLQQALYELNEIKKRDRGTGGTSDAADLFDPNSDMLMSNNLDEKKIMELKIKSMRVSCQC